MGVLSIENIHGFSQTLATLSNRITTSQKSICVPFKQESKSQMVLDFYNITDNVLDEMKMRDILKIAEISTPFITTHIPGDDSLVTSILQKSQVSRPVINSNLHSTMMKTGKIIENETLSESTIIEHSTYNMYNNNRLPSSTLEGSPLKLEKIADLSCWTDSPQYANTTLSTNEKIDYDIQQIMSSLPYSTVRQLVSMYCEAFKKYDDNGSFKPMWLLCDGKNKKSCILVGAQPVSDSTTHQKGIKITKICLKGPTADGSHLPKLDKKLFIGRQAICRALYDIFESSEDSKDLLYKGTLQVELEWAIGTAKNISLLQKAPMEALTTIKASVVPGDVRSGIFDLFQELNILKGFISSLADGEVYWNGEPSEEPAMHAVKMLIKKMKLGNAGMETTRIEDDLENEDLSAESTKLTIKSRADKDFTDLLWGVLVNCSSYSELIDCLRYVLKLLGDGDFQPLVDMANPTSFAQMIRNSYTGTLVFPQLTGMYPLMIFAELGAEKLKKDYVHAFLSLNLASVSSLAYYLQPKVELAEKFERLEKLHNILEMVAMQKIFLKLSASCLLTCVSEMLRYYERNAIDDHLFKFSIPTSSIINRINACTPCTWSVEATYSIGAIQEVTKYYMTTDQPFLHISLPKVSFSENSEDTVSKNNYYSIECEESVVIC